LHGINLKQIIYFYPVENFPHLLSCPFEVQCMATLGSVKGFLFIYSFIPPLGKPLIFSVNVFRDPKDFNINEFTIRVHNKTLLHSASAV